MSVFDVLREKLEEGENKRLQLASGARNDIQSQLAACYSHAIEIVNQVEQEYNNDLCEWFAEGREMDVYFTKCGQAHIFVDGTPEENNHEFCPYCGKKIKVVSND